MSGFPLVLWSWCMGVGVRWLSTRYGGNKASAGLCSRGLSSLCHTPAGGLPVSPGLRRCRPVLLMHVIRTRTTKCRMGGSAQRRLPGAWAGTGAPRRIFGWGTLPLRCLIGVGVAACSVCLSVCFRSRVVVGVWLACHPASGLRSANHSCLGGAVVCN